MPMLSCGTGPQLLPRERQLQAFPISVPQRLAELVTQHQGPQGPQVKR